MSTVTLAPERRREYLRGIAHAICVASMRCRIIGPTALALDLSSPRSHQVLRYEIQRYVQAKLLTPEHLVLGRLDQLPVEDLTFLASALPLVSGQIWNEVASHAYLNNSLLVP